MGLSYAVDGFSKELHLLSFGLLLSRACGSSLGVVKLFLVLGGVAEWLTHVVLGIKFLFNHFHRLFILMRKVLLIRRLRSGLNLKLQPLPRIRIDLLPRMLDSFYFNLIKGNRIKILESLWK